MHLHCEFGHLGPALRLLFTSDGTVTDMLQAICGEKIHARKMTQDVSPAERPIDALEIAPGELVMSRRVLLQGERTGTDYVYADSMIAFDRLDIRFQQGLLNSDTPIGRLWRENRLEIFKEILDVRETAAGHLAAYFGTSAGDSLIVRTSRVFMAGRPAMLITEHFSPVLGASRSIIGAFNTQRASTGRTTMPI
jgi:chorismate-pyruvate lyase